MKVIFVCLICFVQNISYSQITDTIEVGFTKSAYLIFEEKSMVKFDCGSENVLVKNSDNKLVLQAGIEDFEETNLFVESGNSVYMFIVKYAERPSRYLYDYAGSNIISNENTTNSLNKVVYVKTKSADEVKKDSLVKLYGQFAERILAEPDRIMNRGIVKYKIGIYLKDIVIFEDKMFFEFEARNNGNIPYILDFYQYRVKSTKRKVKGESFQEVQLVPVLQYSSPNRLEGKSTYKYVIVMDKFALTNNKKLVIEHWEDNGKDLNIEGGRKIDFDIFSNDVLNVRL
jgi:hypothetical protein